MMLNLSSHSKNKYMYGKCPKILNTLLFLFSHKMLVISAGIHRMLVRIANQEDPDQARGYQAFSMHNSAEHEIYPAQ